MSLIRTLPFSGLLALGLLASGALPSHARVASHHRSVAKPHRQPPPPGSITHDRVTSMADLNSEVASYPSVRSRFAKFFHLPESQVPAFIAKNITIGTVRKTRNYNVYYIDKQQQMYKHVKRLHQGASVFVLRQTGQPVLDWRCGNPIIPLAESISVSDYQPPISIAYVNVLTSPDVVGFTAPSEFLNLLPSQGYSYSLESASSPHSLWWLGGLGLIGLDHHHPNPPPPPVPEPGAFTFLLAGLPLIGLALRRRATTR